LTLQGTYYIYGFPVRMATNPAGTVLYVACYGIIDSLSVAPDGTLSSLQSRYINVSTNAEGIVYVPLSGGDFVYLNDQSTFTNYVSAFPVQGDGTLGAELDYA